MIEPNQVPIEQVREGEVVNRPLNQAVRIAAQIQKSEFYSGPLPRPSDMAEYEKTLPGLAERIVGLTEREQAHRHEIEKIAISSATQAESRDSMERRIGQIAAFLIALAGLGTALALGLAGQQAAASVIGGATLTAMVIAFIRGGKSVDEPESSAPRDKSPPKAKPSQQPKKRRK